MCSSTSLEIAEVIAKPGGVTPEQLDGVTPRSS